MYFFSLMIQCINDDSMHKIFLDYGKYNFIQQIPQILYATLVSQLLEVLLSYLSLTDTHFYKIKKLNHPTKMMIFKILRCVKIKLFFFFLICFLFLGFYWYLVSAFCAVYQNTQIIFLKDFIFSFLSGLLYSFILYLLPTFLRIVALRQSKRGLKCLYILSDIIPFF